MLLGRSCCCKAPTRHWPCCRSRSCCSSSASYANGRVVVAARVGEKRIEADGRVAGAARVAKSASDAIGRVVSSRSCCWQAQHRHWPCCRSRSCSVKRIIAIGRVVVAARRRIARRADKEVITTEPPLVLPMLVNCEADNVPLKRWRFPHKSHTARASIAGAASAW